MAIDIVRVAEWARYPWLVHGLSTRSGGVSTVYGDQTLNLGWTKEDAAEAVVANRRLLVEAVAGDPGWKLATLRQVHGTMIRSVLQADEAMHDAAGRALYEGDGLLTAAPGVLLGIQTADCVPVILADVAQQVVAVLHAGWRGTAGSMAAMGVERMRAQHGSRVEDLVAAVGPAIGPCCYTVGEEVRAAFCGGFAYGSDLFAKERLDLWEANRRQLVDAGIAADRIAVVGECTACARTTGGARRYFSHRAEHGVTGRMMSVVGVRASSPIVGSL